VPDWLRERNAKRKDAGLTKVRRRKKVMSVCPALIPALP
jgi:hypothetical protein